MPSISRRFVALVVFSVACSTACGSGDDLAERQATVAEAGVEVMPFALEETTHIFTNTPAGGRQDVVADDPEDVANIELIRQHLAEEANRFSDGDFSDPEAIHGPAMPGLTTLKARFEDINVELTQTATGASIEYQTGHADLVDAIHLWFAAQTSDHGSHAEHNP